MTRAWLCRLEDVDVPPAPESQAPAWLSAEETVRHSRFSHPARLRQFLAGRWLLRRLCAVLRPSPPESWRLSGFGPPRSLAPHKDLWLSLSHSGGWLLAAASDAGPVGVDVEDPTRKRDHLAIARWAFPSEESDSVEALDPTQRPACFYRLWTAKEALFKAGGASGLFESLGIRLRDVGAFSIWHVSQGQVQASIVTAGSEAPTMIDLQDASVTSGAFP